MSIMAVDVGGTKILAGVTRDLKRWDALHTEGSVTYSEMGMYEAVKKAMQEVALKAAIPLQAISGCCVALPGQVDTENGIACYQNNLPWRDFHLKHQLKQDFPFPAICIEHDVMAAALGEYNAGHKLNGIFAYVTISTGISASLLLNGTPVRGQGLAGEIGFLRVGETTLETFASGGAMEKAVRQTWGTPTLSDAMDSWTKGEKELDDFFQKRAKAIAEGLYSLVSIVDPGKIVLGGGVIQHQPAFFKAILNHFQEMCTHSLQADWAARVMKNQFPGLSGLHGAAVKALVASKKEGKACRNLSL